MSSARLIPNRLDQPVEQAVSLSIAGYDMPFYGRLLYEPGAWLQIDYSQPNDRQNFREMFDSDEAGIPLVMHAKNVELDTVTLFGCRREARQRVVHLGGQDAGFGRFHINAHAAIFVPRGRCSDGRIEALEIDIPHLEQWTSGAGYRIEAPEVEQWLGGERHVAVKISQEELVGSTNPEDPAIPSLSLRTALPNYPTYMDGIDKLQLPDLRYRLRVDFKSEIDFEALSSSVASVRLFFSLLLGHLCGIQAVRVRINTSDEGETWAGSLIPDPMVSKQPSAKRGLDSRPYASFDELGGAIGEMWGRWWDAGQALARSVSVLFPHDGYDADTLGLAYLGYYRAIESVVESVSGKDSTNWPRKIGSLPQCYRDAIGVPLDAGLAERLIDARHYYAHDAARREGSALRGEALYKATRILKQLLFVLAYARIGMPHAIIVEARRRMRYLEHLIEDGLD